jgi:hypothetical protein
MHNIATNTFQALSVLSLGSLVRSANDQHAGLSPVVGATKKLRYSYCSAAGSLARVHADQQPDRDQTVSAGKVLPNWWAGRQLVLMQHQNCQLA